MERYPEVPRNMREIYASVVLIGSHRGFADRAHMVCESLTGVLSYRGSTLGGLPAKKAGSADLQRKKFSLAFDGAFFASTVAMKWAPIAS